MTAAIEGTPVVNAVSASSTSHSPNLPSGIVSGELLVISVVLDSATINASATGWTWFARSSTGTTSRRGFLWKEATGSEGASVTVTLTGNAVFQGTSYRISGVDTTDPFNSDNFVQGTVDPASATFNIPASTLTVTDGNGLLCTVIMEGDRGVSSADADLTVIGNINDTLSNHVYIDNAISGTTNPQYDFTMDGSSKFDWMVMELVSSGGDVTAPVLSSPTGTKTGSDTADGTVSTDEGNGTLYFLASTNASETAATIKTGSSQAVSGTGVQNVSFTGLTPSTVYYAHYVHDDAATNESNVVSSSSFTTDAGTPFVGVAGFDAVGVIGKCAGAAVDTGGFLDGDSDPDGDALSYEIVDDVDNGTLVPYIGGAFTYTPDAGFIGKDRFSYLLWAGCEFSGPYIVTIDVDGPYAGIADGSNAMVSLLDVLLSSGQEMVVTTDSIVYTDQQLIIVTFDFDTFNGVADIDVIRIAALQTQIKMGFGGVVDINDIDLSGVSGTISYGSAYQIELNAVNLSAIAASARYTTPMFEFVTRVKVKTQTHRITLRAK